ncbi:hypothetical protein [Sandarakinorhabdus oryzae]|uniref:hypothetical protein n=1 Tax=Sandarakinorhabdus oryzae TaxID=2675220 RepID=UPI0012E26F00|nr:hypothetical protein [Sandarakinorhabdus oryzae]
MARPIAALAALWLLLTAATSPTILMPSDGRSLAFGPQAVVELTPADDGRIHSFGTRPPLSHDSSFTWTLVWRDGAYDVRFEPLSTVVDGRLALRRLPGDEPLYIGQLVEMADGVPGEIGYFLLWRLSRHEFIGYLRLGGSECELVPGPVLDSIGIALADRDTCRVRDWSQLEALMRAYAATRPSPLGTIRLIHHRLPQ